MKILVISFPVTELAFCGDDKQQAREVGKAQDLNLKDFDLDPESDF